MASSRTIIVLCPYGRRQTVKVTQNTSLLEVLEEACRKQGIKPEDYDMSHYNKPLDLSLSVRFANLPNNTMLELNPTKCVRQEGAITVCLQLESGERVIDVFPPSSSIWDIIQKCNDSRDESQKNEIQGKPICIYMRQKIIGDDIKTTTLRSLGLTGGKAIIRLMYRQPETLKEQAHVSMPITKPVPFKAYSEPVIRKATTPLPDYQLNKHMRFDDEAAMEEEKSDDIKDIENELSGSNKARFDSMKPEQDMQFEPMQMESGSDGTDYNANDSKSGLILQRESEVMDIENGSKSDEPEREIGEIIYLGARNAVLFSLEDISEVRKADMPDDFFELTVDDIRYLMNEFKRERNEMENIPLMLKSQRESRLFQQLACYRQTVIRIYFPDKLVLQGTFIADETIQSIGDFIKNFLEDKDLNFYLYITPPKTKLMPEKTLLQARLVPAAIVYFGCDTHRENYLHPHIRTQVSDPRAATAAAMECRKQKIALEQNANPMVGEEVLKESRETAEMIPGPSSSPVMEAQRYVPPPSTSKPPKWFHLGKYATYV